MSAGPYAVVAHRWGLRDAHSYVVRVCLDEAEAKAQAALTVEDRGGKYGVEVTDCCGEQIHYVECPYFGAAGRFNAAKDPADNNKPDWPEAAYLENDGRRCLDATEMINHLDSRVEALKVENGRLKAANADLLQAVEYAAEIIEQELGASSESAMSARAAIAKGKEAAV